MDIAPDVPKIYISQIIIEIRSQTTCQKSTMLVPLFVLLKYLSTSCSTETVGVTARVFLRPRISADCAETCLARPA